MPTGNLFLDQQEAAKNAPPVGNVFLDQLAGPKSQAPTNIFLDAVAASKPKAAAQPTEGDVAALQAQADAAGAPTVEQDSPGLFRRAIDVLMRGDYAAAGAASELFTPQGGGLSAVPGRIANEVLSGIGGFKGKKETFGQVLEEAGVPEMGHFSDLAPWLYNESGEGVRLQRGGWADPTTRGALGLGLDVALDPTTYLGAGIVGKSGRVAGGFLTKQGGRLLSEEAAKASAELLKPIAEGVLSPSMIASARRGATVLEFGGPKSRLAAAVTETLTPSMRAGLLSGTRELGDVEALRAARDLGIAKAKERVQAAIDAGATGLLDKGGIKWAGIHIADNPLSALANSGVAKDIAAWLAPTKAGKTVLSSVAWTKKNLTDPLASLFVKGWGIRGLHGAQPVIDDALNKEAYMKGLARADLVKSPFAPWINKSEKQIEAAFRPVVDLYQAGGIAAVPQEFRPAMTYYAQRVESMYQNEVASGLLGSEQRLQNYYAHYYHNDVDELARVIYKQAGGVGSVKGEVERMLRMGRNAEERVYPTLKAAEAGSMALNAQNKTIPILRGNYNPIDSLMRRWDHSITKRVNREMTTALEAKFGPLPTSAIYDLAQPVKYGPWATFQGNKIETILNAKTADLDKLKAVGALHAEAKKRFFLERFSRISSREEANAVLKKYDSMSEYFPTRLIKADTDFAADGSVFKELNAGSYKATLPETLANELARMTDTVVVNPGLRKMLQGYDTVNNFWKGSVTWLFPAFHARNAYSNVAQSFVDIGLHSVNPKSYKETADILFGKMPGEFKTALGTYSYDEVRDILNRHGVTTSAAAKAEFTGNAAAFDKVRGLVGKARDVGTTIENESRAQLALNYLRRGMDPADVGARVKKFQLDYANGLTSFERQWMKRMIPFYTFQRLNLGLQLDNLLKRPGMALAQVKPFLGRTDENEALTSWDAGALKLRLNRDGKTVQMLTGIDLPIRNLDLLFRGNFHDTMANAVGMLSPILKTPIEVAANKSLFTGREFGRTYAPTAGRIVEQMPVAMQKALGYKKAVDAAGRPQYTFDAQRYYLVAQSFITSRFLSTSDRQFREYIDKAQPNHLATVLDFVTGLRWQEMDLDEQRQQRVRERVRDLKEKLARWGELREGSYYFKPKGTR